MEYREKLWSLPERLDNETGEARRLGVEIEYIGIDIDKSVKLVRARLGGQEDWISDYECYVRKTALGDIRVELDFSYLKKVGRKEASLNIVGKDMARVAESAMAEVARHLVPVEIVSSPVKFSELWRFNDLLTDMREAGAKGTRHSPHYAFGLHLNPDLPDLDVETLLAYLRAFVCLHDWIKDRGKVDWSRRMTPYIDPFESDYLRLVLDPAYKPVMKDFIDDYLEHNPTRNRAMDMLPLFAHIDEARVRDKVDDDRVKARPTLHYRLPNCQLDEPDWSLAVPWRHWLQVEALAKDKERLADISRAYRKVLKQLTGDLMGDWGDKSAYWLLPELL